VENHEGQKTKIILKMIHYWRRERIDFILIIDSVPCGFPNHGKPCFSRCLNRVLCFAASFIREDEKTQ